MISYRNSPPCSPRHLWHIWPRDPMMIEEQIRKSLRTLLKLHRRDWHWETINLGDPKVLQTKRPNPDWSNLWSLFCPGLVQAWQIFHVDRILKMQLQVLILTLYMPRRVYEFMVFWRKYIIEYFRFCMETVCRSSSIEMVFCLQNCSDLLWEKIVLVIEINFWNLWLKAENLQKFW